MWKLIEGGQIVKHRLPRTGKLSDGSSVSNYHKLPPETLKAEGWLPVVENKPDYDPETEVLQGPNYDIQAEQVDANYTAVPKPEPEPVEPSVSSISLATDKTEVTADGEDFATVTAIVAGVNVDSFVCYVTVDGPPAEEFDIVDGQVVSEFSAEEEGLFRVDYFCGDKQATLFIKGVA